MTTKQGNGEGIVRLLIYSGRPDPEWTLGVDRLEELLQRLKSVVGNEKTNPPPQRGLGYGGFLVRNVAVGGRASEFRVFRGVISEGAGRRTNDWRDTQDVEQWLLDEARRQGHGDVLDAIGGLAG